jgi:hypothetical protein
MIQPPPRSYLHAIGPAFLRPLVVLHNVRSRDRRPHLVDALHKVGHPERRLDQLVRVEVGPALLDRPGMPGRARRPLAALHRPEMCRGDDLPHGLHERVADDDGDVRARVAADRQNVAPEVMDVHTLLFAVRAPGSLSA